MAEKIKKLTRKEANAQLLEALLGVVQKAKPEGLNLQKVYLSLATGKSAEAIELLNNWNPEES